MEAPHIETALVPMVDTCWPALRDALADHEFATSTTATAQCDSLLKALGDDDAIASVTVSVEFAPPRAPCARPLMPDREYLLFAPRIERGRGGAWPVRGTRGRDPVYERFIHLVAHDRARGDPRRCGLMWLHGSGCRRLVASGLTGVRFVACSTCRRTFAALMERVRAVLCTDTGDLFEYDIARMQTALDRVHAIACSRSFESDTALRAAIAAWRV